MQRIHGVQHASAVGEKQLGNGMTIARAWAQVAANFHTEQNFVLEGECSPAAGAAAGFHFPSAAAIVDALRQDPDTRISTGVPKSALDLGTDADTRAFATALCNAPLEEVLRTRFALAHFKLETFDVPGGLLEGLREQLVVPWAAGLHGAGFSFHRCYPILFITNSVEDRGEVLRADTSYHMDQSHVVAWQIRGRKQWSWLRDPSAWADREVRLTHVPGQLARPRLAEQDIVRLEMGPGQALFNKLLTPHWVEAAPGEVAVSLNLSHGGLALDGQLMRNEAELMQHVQQKRQRETRVGGGKPAPPVGNKPAWEGLPGQHRPRF